VCVSCVCVCVCVRVCVCVTVTLQTDTKCLGQRKTTSLRMPPISQRSLRSNSCAQNQQRIRRRTSVFAKAIAHATNRRECEADLLAGSPHDTPCTNSRGPALAPALVNVPLRPCPSWQRSSSWHGHVYLQLLWCAWIHVRVSMGKTARGVVGSPATRRVTVTPPGLDNPLTHHTCITTPAVASTVRSSSSAPSDAHEGSAAAIVVFRSASLPTSA
jgi:hypothetical protein